MRKEKNRALHARKAKLEAKRAALRARLQKRLPKKKKSKKKGLWWKLILMILILLLLLRDCSCSRPPIEGPASPEIPVRLTEDIGPSLKRNERLPKRRRPKFKTKTPRPSPWLASFRLQVAARSPRLAECFVGSSKPGSIKWTTSVEPLHGTVSDHSIESMLQSADLQLSERSCILKVLTHPTYHLSSEEKDPVPTRVSLVIEF